MIGASEESVVLRVKGMDCAEEVTALKRDLSPLVGGESFLSFDLLNSRLVVRKAKDEVDLASILGAINRLGMSATLWQSDGSDQSKRDNWLKLHMRGVLTAISALLIILAIGLHAYWHGSIGDALLAGDGGERHVFPWPVALMYALSVVAGAWFVFPKAWMSAKRFRPDMNLLMTIAVFGAIGLGEWLEAASVTFLFSLSLLLESWSVERARRATKALLDLAPPVARLLFPDGKEKMVAVGDVEMGARFLIKPGERVPLDGLVKDGSSEVNQAPITGESLPVSKKPGEQVFAGTINGNGALEVECNKTADHSVLASIIRLVGEAHQKRAPSEQWVERFAHIYTPTVLVLALGVLLVPPLLMQGAWTEWFYRALVLLVIACPCALVISTPVSIVAALTAAARNGVLVKGGKYMELPAKLRAVAFDKTGTLTRGELSVSQVIPMNEHSEEQLLAIAAAIESRSEHPIARAIVSYANQRGVSFRSASQYETVQGKGAKARIDDELYWLGSHRFLEEQHQETTDVHDNLEELAQKGFTVIAVGNRTHVCGFIAVSDTLRAEARTIVSDLRSEGILSVSMLTGDNIGTARTIAAKVGVDEYFAELLPKDKVEKVAALVEKHGTVAMVGDGVNDAPALARATIGIAMGAAGSDAAIESADIALMTDDIARIPWLIHHSRRTLATVRVNIGFSIAVKMAFMVLTFVGYSSLWAAIAADMGASLLVIFNALRLLQLK